MRKISSETTNLMKASQAVTDAMAEDGVPDALDFAWWSDDRLTTYFKGGEWYNLPVESKSDLYEVLQMRGLL